MLLNPDTELLDDGLDRLAAEALRLAGSCRPAGAEPRRLRSALGQRARGRGLAVGAGARPGRDSAGLGAGAHRALPARAPARGHLAHRRLHRRPDRAARAARAVRPGAAHVRRGHRPRAARGGRRGPALVRPGDAPIVHHGQGSSTLAYGSREGWRPTGTLNWRAALRRAYGPRRETVGWRALRVNLRLRLLAKSFLRRATDRDRAAVEAVLSARPVPELPPAPAPASRPR